MRVYRGLFFLFALIVSIAGNADPRDDLKNAAKRGDVTGVTGALKIGADVNARFEVGRTALMIAAQHGHVQVVETLLDAGGDMYALDNNRRDTLMAAVEHEQVAVVRMLLGRGFDPGLNDWRALKILPAGKSSSIESLSPKQAEIKHMLETRKQQAGSTSRPASVAATSEPPPVKSRPPSITTEGGLVVIEIPEHKVTPEMFKNAATRALLNRGWEIVSVENDRLIGTLTKKENIYKVAVVYAPPLIKISSVSGFRTPKPNWLFNIRIDMLVALSAVLGVNQ